MSDSPKKFRVTVAVFATLLVALLAVSADSLWIDEAYSAHYALQPDIQTWWRAWSGSGCTDVAMPLYMFFLWAWEKLCGPSEWGLRAGNIPWFLLTQAAFWVGLRRWPRFQLAAVLCNACNPFLWRYLDEARPYAMEYSGAAVVFSCLAWVEGASEPVIGATWLFAFGGGVLALCGSTMLGIPWAGGAVLALLCLRWHRVGIAWSPASVLACASSILPLGGLAAYYAWSRNALGGNAGFGHKFGGLCFSAYELLGFVGLGPSRIDVTIEHDPREFFPFIGLLCFFAILLAGVLIIAVRALVHQADYWRLAAGTMCCLILPISFLMGLVLLQGWQPAARHFTPASPAVVLAAALAIAAAWREKSKSRIGWTMAFALLWLVSSIEIRFAARHRRDDYRDAALVGRTALAEGKRIWWVAAGNGADYYDLPETLDPKDGSRVLVYLSSQCAGSCEPAAAGCRDSLEADDL